MRAPEAAASAAPARRPDHKQSAIDKPLTLVGAGHEVAAAADLPSGNTWGVRGGEG